MAPIGKIYTRERHVGGNKARLIAAYAGLELTLVHTSTTTPQDNKTPEYLAKFPVGKIPSFEGADGFLLTESTSIANYVASLAPNAGLLGKTPQEAALIDQWTHFAETEVDINRRNLVGLVHGAIPYTKPIETTMRERLMAALTVINNHLHTATFLVGHRISAADLILTAILQSVFENSIGASERATIPNVVRYFDTLVNQPSLKPIIGEVILADKAKAYTPPAKEKKPATIVEKIKEKIAPKPKAPKEEEEEDEPLVAEEPKAKNPLDDLPKSTLNLEDWKRAYSNLDTRGPGGSLEWFYEKYDAEGYSIWKVAFKYPEELTQTFMSANQIGGFFNRLEGSRKYLFGSMGVLGTNNDSLLEGVLITRGQDIIPVVSVAPDYESYAYEKIDLKNDAQKAYFEGALAWDLEVNDHKWADGKNFK
ncbi:elongation factor 1-gamma [Clavulina sp. PMI_390]|nr:elongation factor 1-gamma [Clavulina sp. PMI_390]